MSDATGISTSCQNKVIIRHCFVCHLKLVFSVVKKNWSAVNGAKFALTTAGNPNNHHLKIEIPLCFNSLMQRIDVRLTENVTILA